MKSFHHAKIDKIVSPQHGILYKSRLPIITSGYALYFQQNFDNKEPSDYFICDRQDSNS